MRLSKVVLVTLGIVAALVLTAAPAQPEWRVVSTFQIGGEGGWDYLTVDPQTHRLYVPRTTHTMVIDAASGKIIADIPGQTNAHGVALAPVAGRGFISDGGGPGAILIFDLKTSAVLGTLPAMPDADGIVFDPASGRVLVVSGRGKALMSFQPDIDPKSGKIAPPVMLRGEPEFLAADAAGKVYINLMDTNEVAVVDLKAGKVIANWPVAPGGQPVGMALDSSHQRLLIGCRGPRKLMVMSARDGKVLSDLPIGESVDAVKFEGGQAFASTAGSQLFVASETSPGKFALIQTVKTGDGARTMAIDPTTHRIYLPAAEFQTGASGRRTPKPGTFKILVVAAQ
ncbi:MAG: YncE family protein [Acidobacteriota bacterium]|nr:YncE family protein [Acidobacteriota bacterium]